MKGVGYTSDILEDAQAYADHAMRAGKVEVADVECAVQARSGWEFGEGAPKDVSEQSRGKDIRGTLEAFEYNKKCSGKKPLGVLLCVLYAR